VRHLTLNKQVQEYITTHKDFMQLSVLGPSFLCVYCIGIPLISTVLWHTAYSP